MDTDMLKQIGGIVRGCQEVRIQQSHTDNGIEFRVVALPFGALPRQRVLSYSNLPPGGDLGREILTALMECSKGR